MSRIKANELRGIWAAVPMSWDEHDRFDEKSYRANIERLCRAGVHGVYTTGSTGEFYALDHDEFQLMVDIQDEICGRLGTPLQIGCAADSTRKAIRLLEYAAGKKHVGAAQVVIPYWMEITDREMLQFFSDLYRACPELPLVHYNVPRAKRFLHGQDYLRVLEAAPNMIGVKFTAAGAHFVELQSSIMLTPQLAFFIAENLLVSGMMLGVRGSYSSLVLANPAFTLQMYDLASRGRWEEAMVLQRIAAAFFPDAFEFIRSRGEVIIDPTFDKGLSIAAGFAVGSQRTRAPHIGWTDETIIELAKWLRANYPQLTAPETM